MKNRLGFILILVATIFMLSCKKDNTTPAPVNNTPYTPPADGSTSNATSFSGIFTTGSYTTDIPNNTVFSNESARVYFSNSPTPYMSSATAVSVNKVYLNADTLMYNAVGKQYSGYYPVNLATETWSVNGANGIASFSISISATTPGFTFSNALPDSISRANGFTVTINNVTNAEKASIMVFDGTNSMNGSVSKNLNTGNNTIVFSGTDLANLITTSTGYIAIVLSNDQVFYFSGKDYQFLREAQYNKHIKIKP